MAMTGRELTEAARQAVPHIANTQLQAQLTAGAPVFVLDVREREEWDAGHIPQATLLPRGRLEGRVEELVPDKNTPIVTH
jgi:rhodanese-related sulfurtransferase